MTKDNKICLVLILLILTFVGGMFAGKAILKHTVVDWDEKLTHRSMHYEQHYNYCPYCGEYIGEKENE